MGKTILVFFLHIVITSIMFSKTNTFSLPMIPIDSPKLQIFPQSLSTHERHQMLANISMYRALSSSIRASNSSTKINAFEETVYAVHSNFFVTQIFFGTNSVLFSPYVLLDTGDHTTWVQCYGCNPCFELSTGNIRVHNSATYQVLRSDDPRCVPREFYQGSCGFTNEYGTGAIARGQMGTDTFRFQNSITRKYELYPGIVFGCGLENLHFHFGLNTGSDNLIGGIFGLTAQPNSLLTQLDSQTHGRFLYCLTSWSEQYGGMSTMHFGDSAQLRGPNVKKIQMNSNFLYHLYFRGISVNGNRLAIDQSICQLSVRTDNHYGFFIDSGSPNTVLPKSAYEVLKGAMVNYFAQYGWQVDLLGQDTYELCYATVPTVDQHYPSVVFHFWDGDQGEVDWEMNDDNMFLTLELDDKSRGFCMTVLAGPIPGVCIFGAYQHANFRVLYDVKNSFFYFAPDRCQENRLM